MYVTKIKYEYSSIVNLTFLFVVSFFISSCSDLNKLPKNIDFIKLEESMLEYQNIILERKKRWENKIPYESMNWRLTEFNASASSFNFLSDLDIISVGYNNMCDCILFLYKVKIEDGILMTNGSAFYRYLTIYHGRTEDLIEMSYFKIYKRKGNILLFGYNS